MPTKFELNEMYVQRVAIGGFAISPYWSSTEVDNVIGWGQNFFDGFQSNYLKFNDFYVRGVRAF